MAEDYAKILKDFTKQFDKVVDVAGSVAGLAEMIKEQGNKGRALMGKVGEELDDPSYKAACKAFEAVEKGKGALIKEVNVLKDECEALTTAQEAIEKAAAKLNKK
jgi:hypothetical protein